MFSAVEDVLRALKGKDVVYVPLRGNAGDSFIVHATLQMFDRLGLRFDIGHEQGVYPGRIVILAGGGNLVKPYHNGLDFLTANIGKCQRLIVLPHTVRAYEEIWNALPSDCVVFCREAPSFDFVRGNTKAHVMLSHDMAFSCDLDETRRQLRLRYKRDLTDRTILIRNAKCAMRSAKYLVSNIGSGTLNAMRGDIERTVVPTSPNIDISDAFAVDNMLPPASLYATAWMSSFIGRFDTVRTSRLHVGIMGAMLGKSVEFYDNLYGKNADVYERSMRDNYANVRWASLD